MISKSLGDKLKRFGRRQLRKAKYLIRNPIYVPVITGFLLILLTFGLLGIFGNSKAIQVTPKTKIVIITHDGIRQVVPSNDKTVGALLKHLKIRINPGDVVEPSLNTHIYQDDFRINIYRAKPVEIVENSVRYFTFSAAKTPRAIADQAGIKLYAADKVTAIPNQNFLKNGAIGKQVVITPAVPVNLNLYGVLLNIRTPSKTVGGMIKEENIHLLPTDQVIPAENTLITANEQIYIVHKGIKIKTVNQTIPMPVQSIYVSNLAYGTNAIVQQGSPGQETITYEINSNNGVVSSTPLATVVTTPPVTEIVDQGDSLSGIQGDMALAGIPPADYSFASYIISHESGWCPTKWQGDIGYCPAGFSQQYADYASVGYGLCQATPPIKMSAYGSDWPTDPITQLEWCNSYANSRYGGWYNAYLHWRYYRNW
jgi:uncharacterized protein YabE (DUF348 family)